MAVRPLSPAAPSSPAVFRRHPTVWSRRLPPVPAEPGVPGVGRYGAGHAPHPVLRGARPVPVQRPHLRRAGGRAVVPRLGAGRDRPPRAVREGRGRRLPRHGHPRRARRGRRRRLPVQPDPGRGARLRGHRRRRARPDPPQRHLPALLPVAGDRGAEGALAAGHRLGRADHRHRHDRARHRLGPGRHDHHRDPRRRPLRRQRVEDLHHQRHQRRPRHHRGEDRPDPAPQGHEPGRARAGHGRLRAGPEPGEDRPPQPGHRRAGLLRRVRCRSPTCSGRRARASSTWCTTCPRSASRSPPPASPRPRRRWAGRSTT